MPERSPEAGSPDESIESALAALEEEQRRLDGATAFLDSDFTVARSENHMVTIELNGYGEVVDIEFDGVKYRELGDTELARMLIDTIRDGRARCVRNLADALGDDVLPADFGLVEADDEVVAAAVTDEVVPSLPDDGPRVGVLARSNTPEEETPLYFPKRSSLVVQVDDDDGLWQSGQSSAIRW